MRNIIVVVILLCFSSIAFSEESPQSIEKYTENSILLQEGLWGPFIVRNNVKYRVLGKECRNIIQNSPNALKEYKSFKENNLYASLSFGGASVLLISGHKSLNIISGLVLLSIGLHNFTKAGNHLSMAVWEYNKFILTF